MRSSSADAVVEDGATPAVSVGNTSEAMLSSHFPRRTSNSAPETPWDIRIELKNKKPKSRKDSTYFARYARKKKPSSYLENRNWTSIPEHQDFAYNGSHYSVGDMVRIVVSDVRSGMTLEPAVIAECREQYVLIAWLFDAEKRKGLFAKEGIHVGAHGYKLVLSTNADVIYKSALYAPMSPNEKMGVCTDAVLHSRPEERAVKLRGADGCYIGKLSCKIKAREPASAARSPISSHLPSPSSMDPPEPPGNSFDLSRTLLQDRRLSLQDTIEHPYIDEEPKLPEPTKNMKDNHDFAAGVYQDEYHLERWKLKPKARLREYATASARSHSNSPSGQNNAIQNTPDTATRTGSSISVTPESSTQHDTDENVGDRAREPHSNSGIESNLNSTLSKNEKRACSTQDNSEISQNKRRKSSTSRSSASNAANSASQGREAASNSEALVEAQLFDHSEEGRKPAPDTSDEEVDEWISATISGENDVLNRSLLTGEPTANKVLISPRANSQVIQIGFDTDLGDESHRDDCHSTTPTNMLDCPAPNRMTDPGRTEPVAGHPLSLASAASNATHGLQETVPPQGESSSSKGHPRSYYSSCPPSSEPSNLWEYLRNASTSEIQAYRHAHHDNLEAFLQSPNFLLVFPQEKRGKLPPINDMLRGVPPS